MFEFAKSLFTLSGFYDQCGAYVRYAAQDDPGLQDMLDAYCDSAGTVVMNLLKEDESLTLKFAIEQGVYNIESIPIRCFYK